MIVPDAPDLPCAGARAAYLSVQHEMCLLDLRPRIRKHRNTLMRQDLQARRDDGEQCHGLAVCRLPPNWQHVCEDMSFPEVVDLLKVDDLCMVEEHSLDVLGEFAKELGTILLAGMAARLASTNVVGHHNDCFALR